MLRRWHHLISALLLVVLSGTPALAAVCLGWCDDPVGHTAHGGAASVAPTDEVAVTHHGAAHHDATGHGAHAQAGSPVEPDPPPPCHGAPASDGTRLGAALVVACDDALAATEGVSLGAKRVDPLTAPVAVVQSGFTRSSAPMAAAHRHPAAGATAVAAVRAPLVLRI